MLEELFLKHDGDPRKWKSCDTKQVMVEECKIFYHIMSMHLNIKSDEAHRLAAELSHLTGETLTSAVTVALRERLERERRRLGREAVANDLMAIGKRYANLPDETSANPDEIIGYGDNGLPK